MPVAEFNAWFLRYQEKPFGDRRGDIRIGILASLLANIHRDPSKRTEVFEAEEFMPKFLQAPRKPQSVEEQVNVMLFLQAAQNAILKNQAS